jgi:tRNA threonylcarbamoyladenosine biosynthesis protein TsaB
VTILGIETSDDYVGVGLADDSGTLISRASAPELRNKNELHSFLEETLRLAGVDLKEIDGIAVSIGPGSFTGLRVGLAAAKGICWSRNIPLAGVSSTEAIAACAGDFKGKLLAIKDARRNEFYFGGFENRGDGWNRILDDRAAAFDEIISLAPEGFRIAGRLSQLGDAIQGEIKELIIDYDPEKVAGAVARLGHVKLKSGLSLEVKSAAPYYVRNPGIGMERGR